MKLIVVGAGIAGSALCQLAEERGHDVTLVSDGVPDSLAATAVLRRGYHAGKPDQLAALDYALDCYQRWGVPVRRGGLGQSYRRLGDEPVADEDWLLLDPAAPLAEPDVRAEILTVKNGTAWLGAGRSLEGDAVVVATGAREGNLQATGSVTWGVTLVHSHPEALRDEQIRIYQWAPYRTIVAGVVNGEARVGSSSARSPDAARNQMTKMLEKAWGLGWLTTRKSWGEVLGARLKTEQLSWRDPEDGAWRLAGFHRTGYALAPAAARDLLSEIELTVSG